VSSVHTAHDLNRNRIELRRL